MAPSSLAPSRRNVVVMGASAGGVEGLLAALDTQVLDAAVLIVLHVAGDSHTMLPEILGRRTGMRARLAGDGDELEAGLIMMAPPDYHLVVDESGSVRLWRGPRENRSRPAIDPLFRSAAAAYGPRVVGVIMSGVLDDGSAGLAVVRARGGLAVVQDPDEALFPQMPRNAIARAGADYVVPLTEICALLQRLTEEEVPTVREEDKTADPESSAEELEAEATSGELTGLTCPECGGALWEHAEREAHVFRCRVGHAYAPASLRSAQVETVENALWAAMRALEEQASLSRRSAERLTESKFRARLLDRADEAMRQAEIVRSFIAGIPGADDEVEASPG